MPIFAPNCFAHTDISVPDANELILTHESLIIVDVRNPDEFCGWLEHIPGAINYPYNTGYFQENYTDFDPNDELLLVCYSGGRSEQAAQFLDNKGYSNVYDILGGTFSWNITHGYETEDCPDFDNDDIEDPLDNCPGDYNPSQTDSDSDGIGNACDSKCPNLDGFNPVDFDDFSMLCLNWQRSGPALDGDLNGSQTVDSIDLLIFVQYWLADCHEE